MTTIPPVKCRVKATARNGRPQSASTTGSTAATTTTTNNVMARTKQGLSTLNNLWPLPWPMLLEVLVIPWEDDDFKLAVPELFHSGSLNKCLVKPQGTWVMIRNSSFTSRTIWRLTSTYRPVQVVTGCVTTMKAHEAQAALINCLLEEIYQLSSIRPSGQARI